MVTFLFAFSRNTDAGFGVMDLGDALALDPRESEFGDGVSDVVGVRLAWYCISRTALS